MSTQHFSEVERTSFLLAHGRKCVYCDDPLSWRDMHLDHVVPEWMGKAHDELAHFLVECRVSPDFDVRSYENILPSHSYCNRRKGGEKFRVQATIFFLEIAARSGPKVRTEMAAWNAKLKKELDRQWKKMVAEASPFRPVADATRRREPFRRGVPRANLRAMVVANYGARCAFSGVTIQPLLQVASIRPLADGGDLTLHNMLLMTADMHALYDRGLISVDPITMKIAISSKASEYASLNPLRDRVLAEGVALIVPPARDAIAWHYESVFIR